VTNVNCYCAAAAGNTMRLRQTNLRLTRIHSDQQKKLQDSQFQSHSSLSDFRKLLLPFLYRYFSFKVMNIRETALVSSSFCFSVSLTSIELCTLVEGAGMGNVFACLLSKASERQFCITMSFVRLITRPTWNKNCPAAEGQPKEGKTRTE
jgi:hypothetical protein